MPPRLPAAGHRDRARRAGAGAVRGRRAAGRRLRTCAPTAAAGSCTRSAPTRTPRGCPASRSAGGCSPRSSPAARWPGSPACCYAARFGTLDANAGIGSELNVVAAVVVGGVAIFGGSGSVYGAALGAVLLTTIGSALPVLGINPFWQRAAVGALILAAIGLDRALAVRMARRLRGGQARGALTRPTRAGAPRAVARAPRLLGRGRHRRAGRWWSSSAALTIDGVGSPRFWRFVVLEVDPDRADRAADDAGRHHRRDRPVGGQRARADLHGAGPAVDVGRHLAAAARSRSCLRARRACSARSTACSSPCSGCRRSRSRSARWRSTAAWRTSCSATGRSPTTRSPGRRNAIAPIPGTTIPWIDPRRRRARGGVRRACCTPPRSAAACTRSATTPRPPRSPASRSPAPSSGCSCVTGAMSSLAGVFWTFRFASARADNATGLELSVVAAVLLGGVSIFGGRGGLVGVLAAVVLLGTLRNALQLADVPANALTIVTGSLLIASVVGPERRRAMARDALRRRRPVPAHRRQDPAMTHPTGTTHETSRPPRSRRSTLALAACADDGLRRATADSGAGDAGTAAGTHQGGPEDRLPAQAGQQPVLRHLRQQGRQGRRRGVQGHLQRRPGRPRRARRRR